MNELTGFTIILMTAITIAGTSLADDQATSRPEPQTQSLLGQPLYPPAMSDEVRSKREADLREAQRAYDADPRNEDAIIWLGRRQAYLGDYRLAIETFSRGLVVHPDSSLLLRHRGHRYISVREFERAIADLSRAASLITDVADEVEPDGLPNSRNQPTSTSHTNIYYHLALAHYVRGEFDAAVAAWRRCLEFSKNDDMRCAASYWLYLALRRAGRADEADRVLAPIHADMDIIENHGYWRLLLMFKGEMTADDVRGPAGGDDIADATTAYGLAAWQLLEGRRDQALRDFKAILDLPAWPAFGYIAAEAEVARQVPGRRPRPIGDSQGSRDS